MNDRVAAPTSPDLLEIAVEVAGVDGELAADIFRQKCPGGVVIEPGHRLDAATETYVVDGDAPAVVKGYVPASPEAESVRKVLRLALSMAPLLQPAKWRRTRRLREETWRDAWKKHFGIQRIGRSLVIAPSWVRYEARDGETVVRIDPGMAFGTGQHPTTAMCLRALEEHVRPGLSVLDVGCGSGILAIAAAKLGAGRVLAVDIDPQAVKAAGENVLASDVAGVIEVREGSSLEAAGGERFGLVVANISGLALERLAQGVSAALADGGMLVASGFLEDAVDGLSRAFGSAGLAVRAVMEDGAWRAIVAERGQ
jgi:ribosomal protein L11 methyltransferase